MPRTRFLVLTSSLKCAILVMDKSMVVVFLFYISNRKLKFNNSLRKSLIQDPLTGGFFEGNMATPQLENGYTKIANELLGEMIKLHLSGNEWSILHCVMRKTWGWNKKEDCISLSQFEKETGLPRPTVNKNIKSLVAKKLLVAKLLPSGNIYQIQKDYSMWDSSNNNTSSKIATTLVAKSPLKLVAKLLPTKETTKETIQKKHLPSEKDFNEIDIESICNDYQVPESFVLSKWDDVLNYCLSNNKKYADYNRTLRNWVKKDSIKLKQEAHGKSTIGFVKTE